MNKHILIITIIALAILIGIALTGTQGQDKNFVTFGTGGITGVYYPTGGAISKLVNNEQETYNIKAAVASTGGSVFNINAVLAGNLEFGVVQSDRQYEAYNGLAEWESKGPQKDLRSVFSIYPEAVTLVASTQSAVNSVADLRGKRVNLGNVGSGQLQNALTVLEVSGLSEDDLRAEKVKAAEAPGLLQDGRLDAFFYTVGHPNGNIKEATSGRIPVRIVPITGPGIEKLVAENPFYSTTSISAKMYPQAVNTTDIPTFGVMATLVTAEDIPEDIVYAVTKEVFENLDEFKNFHPAFTSITAESMLKGLSAPLHKGAVRYYKEAGLLEKIDKRLLPADA